MFVSNRKNLISVSDSGLCVSPGSSQMTLGWIVDFLILSLFACCCFFYPDMFWHQYEKITEHS